MRAVIQKVSGSPVIKSFADYYPFGEQLPNRNSNSGNYRYAFQGQELDGETGMEAFQLRLWDGRIGRWLSPDPYGQYASPYLGMGNNPVSRIDPDGGKDDYGLDANGKVTLIKTTADTFDRLIAGNGDVIDGNIQKGILWSGMDLGSNVNLISLSQLNMYGDKVSMSEVDDLLFRVSLYEQKEIAWGKYNSFLDSDGIAVVNPYKNNTHKSANSMGISFIRNGQYYLLSEDNHTHPSFAPRFGYGDPSPAESDGGDLYLWQKAPWARGIIYSREGVTEYGKGHVLEQPNLKPTIQKRKEWITQDYVKKNWGWRKNF